MDDDVNAMVEAVLDVLAPKIPPDVLAAIGAPMDSPDRMPIIRMEEGWMPSAEDMRALAEKIVTAIRTATMPSGWTRVGDIEERPVAGGLTGVVSPSAMVPGMYGWSVVLRGTNGYEVKAAGGPLVTAGLAKASVLAWEDTNTEGPAR